MTESEKKDIAENYIKALTNRDAALLTSIATEDIVWSLPGTSRLMSGEARGVDSLFLSLSLSLSEPKPCGELEGSTGDRGARDPTDAWIRNTRGEGDRVEAVAGILEAWMVEEVGGIHSKL